MSTTGKKTDYSALGPPIADMPRALRLHHVQDVQALSAAQMATFRALMKGRVNSAQNVEAALEMARQGKQDLTWFQPLSLQIEPGTPQCALGSDVEYIGGVRRKGRR